MATVNLDLDAFVLCGLAMSAARQVAPYFAQHDQMAYKTSRDTQAVLRQPALRQHPLDFDVRAFAQRSDHRLIAPPNRIAPRPLQIHPDAGPIFLDCEIRHRRPRAFGM